MTVPFSLFSRHFKLSIALLDVAILVKLFKLARRCKDVHGLAVISKVDSIFNSLVDLFVDLLTG